MLEFVFRSMLEGAVYGGLVSMQRAWLQHGMAHQIELSEEAVIEKKVLICSATCSCTSLLPC